MKILIVEDDRNMAQVVKDSLTAYSHTVDISSDGADGSFLARSYEYDAIVLDYNLPKKDGLAICREIRAAGKTTPIIFMSVTDDPTTKIAALRQGADDYITKPFSLEELRARLDAVSRRSPVIKQASLRVGDLFLDSSMHKATRSDSTIQLTRKEFHMLEYFMQNAGTILSRAQLMEHIWTADGNPFSNTVEAHIRNLRKKLNADGAANLIINVPGRGYILDSPENLARFK
ncbi:MAG: putative Two-component transcriptional regulator [Candidatus Parcubacteria bacterium]|nr:putative Two-component transcriptional regulator [Candidatus Parcubacteria bacterium]